MPAPVVRRSDVTVPRVTISEPGRKTQAMERDELIMRMIEATTTAQMVDVLSTHHGHALISETHVIPTAAQLFARLRPSPLAVASFRETLRGLADEAVDYWIRRNAQTPDESPASSGSSMPGRSARVTCPACGTSFNPRLRWKCPKCARPSPAAGHA